MNLMMRTVSLPFEVEVQKLEADQFQLGTCTVFSSNHQHVHEALTNFEIFLSWFTNIFNLIYFPIQIVNEN
jgi:hypothetical protein